MSPGYLLNTNVISEPTQQRPDPIVQRWLNRKTQNPCTSVQSQSAKSERGIALLGPGKRRTSLEHWFQSRLLEWASGSLLPITQTVADRWGTLTASRQLAGEPIGLADSLIAATALEHNLVLVTQNIRHFRSLGVSLLNPWNSEPTVM